MHLSFVVVTVNVLLKFAVVRVASNTVCAAACIDVLCARLATACSAVVASPNSFTKM